MTIARMLQTIFTAPTAVTFRPASHLAESYLKKDPSDDESTAEPKMAPEILLQGACPNQYSKCAELLQSSIPKGFDASEIILQRNGLVHTLLEAYNEHRARVLRPIDVWLAILTQFSFYVSAYAEERLSLFVAHKGKKELRPTAYRTRYTVDFGRVARQTADLLEENLTDPALRMWATPKFSTTTITDNKVFAIALMATTKSYWETFFGLCCGIPRVTLDGTREDWEVVLQSIDKLKEFGFETTAWYHLLRPVLACFVNAFDDPDGEENIDFWGRVAHLHSGMSGPTYLMGWATTFCVFDAHGKWQGPFLDNIPSFDSPSQDYAKLSGEAFAKEHLELDSDSYLVLDGVPYPHISMRDIPAGTFEVDVKLDDNGEMLETLLVAGSMGSAVSLSNDISLSKTEERDIVRPVPGWWMFIKK
ncbi:hypothetical protein CONPUDRAFT_153984 [Coniophora puteana RWD-64-598 SS2]|uniref:DUF4419 domain-containing protein n=1 Tax=Coniophora puteana (strain RWD-64-598) TaxID=741705 RepID=A0A5M3MQF7_CONPW|nr:uncharacterized protein CONPUDRAFT_153984 [Coniophora puteana RWD-64-598 SS2]EIW81438.1 hypothetical protein CONPUDRAFT_153984 [Coniophora puteana RWD-64-598 SS2]